jgi:hypothetical protein
LKTETLHISHSGLKSFNYNKRAEKIVWDINRAY